MIECSCGYYVDGGCVHYWREKARQLEETGKRRTDPCPAPDFSVDIEREELDEKETGT